VLAPFGDPRDGVALVVFLAVAMLVGQLNNAARRRAETLRRSEGRWHSLIAAEPIGIATMDAQGRILAANDAFCALSGYPRQELAGVEIWRLFPGEQQAAIRDEWLRNDKDGCNHDGGMS
jgi:PAS domain-containing protein